MTQTPENQQQYGSILTILGENAEQNGKLQNKQITFTHMAIGDANDEYVQPDRKQTALVNELARIPVNSVDVLQPTPDSVPMLKVEAILPDDVNDLVIREFAAVATFDGNTYFHAVGNNARIYVPPPVNNGNVSTPVTLEMIFVITSADPIVEIDPHVVTASRAWTGENFRDLERASTYLNTFSELLAYEPREGEVIKTRGYYQRGDGGAGTYVVLDAPDTADNLGGIVEFKNGLKGFLDYDYRVNPLQFGAIDGKNITVEQQNENTRRIQASFDFSLKIKFSRKFWYGGSLKITSGHSLKGVNRALSGLYSLSLFEAAIKDSAVDKAPGHATNTTSIDIRKMKLSSDHQDVIHCRPYMWFIELNDFSCPNGKGFHMDGNSYQVENNIRKNYFNGCKYGIYGMKGTHGPTDQYIIDNWFWGNGVQHCAIKLQGLSGSTIRGNHVYGGAKEYMMDLAEGENVSLNENYFEDDVRPRLKLTAGNPATWTINGNKFWGGDGDVLDPDGNPQCLIELHFSPWTTAELVFTGNIFGKGKNNVNIFRTNHSTHEQDKGQEIKLGPNVYNGSYDLGEKTGRVHCDELFVFYELLTEQSPYSALENPLTVYQHTGHSEGWLSIPNNKSLTGITKRIWNKSANTVLNISTSKPVVGKNILQPGEMIKITFDEKDDCYYSFLG